MKVLSIISRLLVGSLFIVSGLVKANDPLGFSYKLAEYFTEDVLGFTWLGEYALSLAILVCVAEIVLGVACLFGAKMKVTSISLLITIVFFTFLTWYSAYYEKVSDCGCFGDAIPLTPWKSFSKDVVLLVFILVIFIDRKNIISNSVNENKKILTIAVLLVAAFCLIVLNNAWIFPIYFTAILCLFLIGVKAFINNKYEEWVMGALTGVISLYFCLYCINHLPIKDFRPFAIGKSIPEQMVVPEGEPLDEYETIYKMKSRSTGEVSDVDSKKYLADKIWENKDLEIVKGSTVTTLIKEGYHPPIHDFYIYNNDEEDITDKILGNQEVSFILIASQIKESDVSVQNNLNKLVEIISESGYQFFGLTASVDDDVQDYRHENQSMFPYYAADETLLKTIIRSNPGLLMLKKGVILGKWHFNDLPTFAEIEETINKAS